MTFALGNDLVMPLLDAVVREDVTGLDGAGEELVAADDDEEDLEFVDGSALVKMSRTLDPKLSILLLELLSGLKVAASEVVVVVVGVGGGGGSGDADLDLSLETPRR